MRLGKLEKIEMFISWVEVLLIINESMGEVG